ncbi:DNA-directed RNA polymerase subunit beta, partial [Candidatus Marinamargulisbacteria bacterium SCGC AG-414-C22]
MTTKEKDRIRLNPEKNWDDLIPPNLIGIQLKSFKTFLNKGIKEELRNISPIKGYGGKLQLELLDDYFFEEPEFAFDECQHREITYCASLKVPVRLTNNETGEVIEQVALLGDIPMMSEFGTFLINGAERIIVSQFVRSPGVYFRIKPTTVINAKLFMATIIPNRGAWLEIESEKDDTIFANVNKLKKVPLTLLLGALGFTESDVLKAIKHKEYFQKTIDKYPFEDQDTSLVELNKKLRPGDPVTVEGAKNALNSLFFDPDKYDLTPVGRYRLNRRLENKNKNEETYLLKDDILLLLDQLLKLIHKEGSLDDIDHLGNRRIRSVGEQLQKQMRVGLARLERLIVEQMSLKANENIVPQNLINIRPLVAVLREFFGSSQLSQFMDQTNPLAEIAHKRRLSALGPGGLTKERAGFDVRDIHPSHYGRVCPIETPEGPNAGLIGPLATYAIVNEYGFIETPYRVIDNGNVTDEIIYISADEEDKLYICPWDSHIENDKLKNDMVIAKYNRDFTLVPKNKIQYMGISPKQLIGVSCGLIPFLEHDDANRALMGANMQRQAVPLIQPEQAYVGTGLEKIVARDSSSVLKSRVDGVVTRVTAEEVVINTKT